MESPSVLLGLMFAGACIGTLGGMLGIGGGVLVIPVLTFFFGFSHKMAVGTSLAMLLPPIGLLAVMDYWRQGNVNTKAAVVLALSFALGAWLGSRAVNQQWVSESALRKLFGFFLIYIASNMIYRSDAQVWAAVRAVFLMAAFAVPVILARMVGASWDRRFSGAEFYRIQAQKPVNNDFEI